MWKGENVAIYKEKNNSALVSTIYDEIKSIAVIINRERN